MQKKTLNEILFEQLDRLSNATSDNIDLEKDKAIHIISVSEQVLNVARLKLDIISAGDNVISQFEEIDQPTQVPYIEESLGLTETPNDGTDYSAYIDKVVKIFNGNDEVYWGRGEVTDFMDEVLFLRDVKTWNNKFKPTDKIDAKYISRIEIVNKD